MSEENADTYVIEVEWEVPGLPRLVGPFPTQSEAEDWGALNVPNGVWNVAPLAWPYAKRPTASPETTNTTSREASK